MREYIYGCAVSRLIDYDCFVNDIMRTRWDIDQLQSQHSTYVDNILVVRSFYFINFASVYLYLLSEDSLLFKSLFSYRLQVSTSKTSVV